MGGGDPRCSTTVTVLTPDLTIVKTANNSGTVVVDDVVQYTIVVTNTGEAPYPEASITDSLAGVLDDATYGNDASASSGTVTYADDVSAGPERCRWTRARSSPSACSPRSRAPRTPT